MKNLNYRCWMFGRSFSESIRHNHGLLPSLRMSCAWFTCVVIGDVSRKNRKTYFANKG